MRAELGCGSSHRSLSLQTEIGSGTVPGRDQTIASKRRRAHGPGGLLSCVAKTLVARYHDELRRTPDGWKLTRRVAEFLWGESRPVDDQWLSALGGRKNVWPNPAI